MTDMEKVIKGLECCVRTIYDCECADNCPYETQCWEGTMYLDLMRDALALLKSQEPRVMTLEEVKHAEIVYLEFQDIITARIVDFWFGSGDGYIRLPGIDGVRYMPKAEYGDLWRCWTSRPDEKVRAETPWQG